MPADGSRHLPSFIELYWITAVPPGHCLAELAARSLDEGRAGLPHGSYRFRHSAAGTKANFMRR